VHFGSRYASKALRIKNLNPYLYQLISGEREVLQKAFHLDKLLLIEHCIFIVSINTQSLNDILLNLISLSIEDLSVFHKCDEGDSWKSLTVSLLNEIFHLLLNLFLLYLCRLCMGKLKFLNLLLKLISLYLLSSNHTLKL